MFILLAALLLFAKGNEIRGDDDELTENAMNNVENEPKDRRARNFPLPMFDKMSDYDSDGPDRNAQSPQLDFLMNLLYRKIPIPGGGGGGGGNSSSNSTSPSERQDIGGFINRLMRRLFRAFTWF